MTTAILVLVAIVIIGLIVLAAVSIKIVREYQRVVLFRLGRAVGPRAWPHDHQSCDRPHLMG